MKKTTIVLSISILIALLILSCSTESTPVYQLTTLAEPSEAGTVTPSSAEAEEGESVTITATANEHWIFDRWGGDHSGAENPASIVMDSDRNVTALFVKQDYPLTIEKVGEGTVHQQVIQSKTTDYPHGTLVELTAEPDAGWEFIEWSGDIDSKDEVIEVNVGGDTNVTVTFERIEYPLTITIEGDGIVEQEIISSPKTTEHPFETVVQLTSKPNDGWVFIQWSGDLSGDSNPVNIEIDEVKDVTSTFKSIDELLTIEVSGQGSVEIDQESFETAPSRRTLTLTALPNEGWRFADWSGDVESNENPITLKVDKDFDIRGSFTELILSEVAPLSRSNVAFHSVRNAGFGRMYASTSEILINDNEDGIWLSEDYGSTWSQTYNAEAVFITASKEDPDLVIAGLKDGGYAISQNGGRSWNTGRINDPFGNSITFTDASMVNKSSAIYLSSRHATRSGIFRSNNLGNSWQHIFSGSDAINTFGSLIDQIEVVKSSQNVIYARTGFAHDIIKSSNAGSSFVSIKNGLPANITSFGAMKVNPSNEDELFISNNISGNGGISWNQQSISANNHFWYNGYLMQVTSNSIRKSNNLGRSWTTILNFGDELTGVSGSPSIEMASEYLFLKYNDMPRYRISLELLKN